MTLTSILTSRLIWPWTHYSAPGQNDLDLITQLQVNMTWTSILPSRSIWPWHHYSPPGQYDLDLITHLQVNMTLTSLYSHPGQYDLDLNTHLQVNMTLTSILTSRSIWPWPQYSPPGQYDLDLYSPPGQYLWVPPSWAGARTRGWSCTHPCCPATRPPSPSDGSESTSTPRLKQSLTSS